MTKKELEALREQLAQYLPELKVEIDGAKNDLKNSRTLKTQIEGVVSSSNDLLNKLNDPTTGINAKLVEGQKSVEAIAEDAASASETLKAIEDTLTTATTHVGEMETAYANFLVIKQKIDEPTTGLAITLDTVRKLRQQAKTASTNADNLLTKVEKTLDKVNTYITNMDTAYDDFETSKKKVDDPNNGLDAVLTASQKLRDDIKAVAETSKTLFAQINKYKEEASKNVDGIKKNKTDSDTTLGKIKEHETESEETKGKINQIFELVSQTGHAHYFNKRSKYVSIVAWVWLGVGVLALAIAIWLAHDTVNQLLNRNNLQNAELAVLIARAVIFTPVVALAVYAFRNYGQERRLAEQYAFKEVSASTIEGSIGLVQRTMKDNPPADINEKLLAVAIDTMRDLHTEPTELQRTSRFSFKSGGKLLNITGEIQDTLEDIDKGVKAVAQNTGK
jgi:chromosome segregation ATPase